MRQRLLGVSLALVAVLAMLGSVGAVQARGTGPEFPHYAGGEGMLPSGETFAFSVGNRWDGATLGWMVYQRPGWRPFTATRITHVRVYGQHDVDIWGEGAFWDDPAVPFHLVVTGNQAGGAGRDSFRIQIWGGRHTPQVNSVQWLRGEASPGAWLTRGAIRALRAEGPAVCPRRGDC